MNLLNDASNETRVTSSNHRAFFNENSRQAFYRAPSTNPLSQHANQWTMRNHYQNLARKSMNKMRHNSMSKFQRIFLRVV